MVFKRGARKRIKTMAKNTPVIMSSHFIEVGDKLTTEELVRDGNYTYATPGVSSKNFPVRPHERGIVEVVLIKFDYDPGSNEAVAEAKRLGLEQPIYEYALYFGAQYPDVQCVGPVVFLHEPWQDPDGYRHVLYLWGFPGHRLLRVHIRTPRDDPWGSYVRFAFVRK